MAAALSHLYWSCSTAVWLFVLSYSWALRRDKHLRVYKHKPPEWVYPFVKNSTPFWSDRDLRGLPGKWHSSQNSRLLRSALLTLIGPAASKLPQINHTPLLRKVGDVKKQGGATLERRGHIFTRGIRSTPGEALPAAQSLLENTGRSLRRSAAAAAAWR